MFGVTGTDAGVSVTAKKGGKTCAAVCRILPQTAHTAGPAFLGGIVLREEVAVLKTKS